MNEFLFAQPVTIYPGQLWPDADGAANINAHCGQIIKAGSLYYWFGENRNGNRQQVNCYASADLSRWTFRNTVLKDLGAEDGFIERPKVIYNDKIKKFVMWMHKEGRGGYNEARAAIAVCNTPDGDYTYLGSFRPDNNMSRDDYLFKDDDGKAYFISSSNDNADLKLYQLTDDYLKIDHEITTLFKGQYREAPVLLKRNGIYYLITSFATGIKPNPQYYATATSITGPWSENKYLASNRTWNTYYSQAAYAFVVQGTKATTYIFGLDRWVRPMRHVWLPLEFEQDGSIKPLQWYDEWQVDAKTGEAVIPSAPMPLKKNLAKGKKVTATYDSAGAMFDYGHFANHIPEMAVDGNPQTAWAANDNLAHWLKIDLQKSLVISKIDMAFWRKGKHHYKIEVSNDGKQWQTVEEQQLKEPLEAAIDSFQHITARYVKFWYLGSESGYNWTALRELSVYSGTDTISLNKPVTSDDYQYPTIAANVTDGNFATAWVIDNEELPQSVIIDLNKPSTIKGVRILWEATGVAHQYKIEDSDDEKNWDLITDQVDNKYAQSLSVHEFNKIKKRYIRVTLTGFDNLGVEKPREGMRPWPGIREIEVN